MIKTAVLGAAGRMGQTACQAVLSDSELELVAAVDPAAAGSEAGGAGAGSGVVMGDNIEQLAEAGAQVAVDFTVHEAALANLGWLAEHGIHAVVGTTGFSEPELAQIGEWFAPAERPNCLVVPNFAISAVLMMRFAELAAPHFPSAEIIELHHHEKVDAPSGTAMATLRKMEQASQNWHRDPTSQHTLPDARGAVGEHGVRVHSVRAEGLLAHQEVIFGGPGQALRIQQDSFDRQSFMPGMLLAVKRVAELPGLTVGLESLLGI